MGRTGLTVGPLGISASYGVPAGGVERAVDAGHDVSSTGAACGARRSARPCGAWRGTAIASCSSSSRTRGSAAAMTWSVERALRRIGYEHADVLLLGYWNGPVPPRILDTARTLQRPGPRELPRGLEPQPVARGGTSPPAAISTIVHLRYNAAHPGAERDLFPRLTAERRPGIVAFTATSWGQLLNPRFTPAGERTPTAGDCYRFVLSHPAVDLCVTGPATDDHVEQAPSPPRRWVRCRPMESRG